jgi:hypothetical protein
MWRATFIDALHLVGEAAARLPVGASDPILCGESAIELYTGGLWETNVLALHCSHPRLLTAELFAAGFRWSHCPRDSRPGLWHPELRVAVEIADDRASLGPAELANLLMLSLDVKGLGRVGTSLNVSGVEDVIVEQVASWRSRRVSSSCATARIQVLVALAGRGVGGPLRAGYLRRRLAHDTRGEVALETEWPGEGSEYNTPPRTMAISSMATVINTWCIARGYASERVPHTPHRRHERSGKKIGRCDDDGGREGGSRTAPGRIIPLDGVQPISSA